MFRPVAGIIAFDERALRFSGTLRKPAITMLMRLLTHSGSGFVWFGLTFAFIALYKMNMEIMPGFLTFISCMFGAFLSLLCGQIMKRIIRRPRPVAAHNWVVPLIKTPSDGSFPSTHASTAIALATGLILAGHFTAPLIIAWSLLVAFSRYYLQVHYPSDILAGALIGLAFGVFDYSSFVATVL